MTESPQSAESQPVELTFSEEMYKDGSNYIKHWQKVMYTYKIPTTGFEEEANPILMRAEFMGGLLETSFMEVIWSRTWSMNITMRQAHPEDGPYSLEV